MAGAAASFFPSRARSHFYYNKQWQCPEERDYAGSLDRQYVWHPYYIDALAVTYDGSGNKVYLLHDANFNVTAAILFNGALLERYHYSPYGEVTVLDADFSLDTDGASDIGNEHLYTGRRTDPVTGLQLNRHRYYHAKLGRWLTRDPIGYADSMHLYQYTASTPALATDPFGTFDFWPGVNPNDCLCIRTAKENYLNEWWHTWEYTSVQLKRTCPGWNGTLDPNTNPQCAADITLARWEWFPYITELRQQLFDAIAECCNQCNGFDDEPGWRKEDCGCSFSDASQIGSEVPVHPIDIGL